MKTLYFKDANGNFCPIDISYLDLRRNQLVIIQIDESFTSNKLEGLLEVLECIRSEYNIDKTEFLVLPDKIKFDVLDRDKDLNSKEILLDINAIPEDQRDGVKNILHSTLKKFHHEYIRFPTMKFSGNS